MRLESGQAKVKICTYILLESRDDLAEVRLPKDGGVLGTLHHRQSEDSNPDEVCLAEQRVDPGRFAIRSSGGRHCGRWYTV